MLVLDVDLPALPTYLYEDLDVDYPVLATVASLCSEIGVAERRIEISLAILNELLFRRLTGRLITQRGVIVNHTSDQ